MKNKLKLLLPLFAIFTLMACDKDDDHYRPDPAVTKSFNTMFPNASRVEWEYKNGYIVADFRDDKNDKDAWFDANGTWLLTETDLTASDIPSVVKQAISKSIYADWRVEDASYVQRKDLEPVYVVEIEKGEAEMDLYYSAEGVLLKAVSENGDHQATPDPVNAKIVEAVNAKYAGARILEIDVKPSTIEVDLLKDNLFFEMTLDREYKWLQTTYDDIAWSVVPQAVKSAFAEGGYTFNPAQDDVEKLERPGNPDDVIVYRIELDREPNDIVLLYTQEGVKLDK